MIQFVRVGGIEIMKAAVLPDNRPASEFHSSTTQCQFLRKTSPEDAIRRIMLLLRTNT